MSVKDGGVISWFDIVRYQVRCKSSELGHAFSKMMRYCSGFLYISIAMYCLSSSFPETGIVNGDSLRTPNEEDEYLSPTVYLSEETVSLSKGSLGMIWGLSLDIEVKEDSLELKMGRLRLMSASIDLYHWVGVVGHFDASTLRRQATLIG